MAQRLRPRTRRHCRPKGPSWTINASAALSVEGPAGFPSPANDHLETAFDLSVELIEEEESTFFVHEAGESMTKAGIHDDKILVVDCSVKP
ncbi:SOS-response transcriptional repressor LexA [Salinibacter ruber]|jgi:SOS-response transcriptional repressor LexA|uniref:S24 family peptidase n=1 Tax=Salinibacter ruber TaxID=146919 RepID=UPI002451F3F8|nr:SOS-response transcriptional repressor LexA [Salinibacter ruber]MCS3713774.1 SOS-response transcriptional repressor LexA [Salinibacter ruber]